MKKRSIRFGRPPAPKSPSINVPVTLNVERLGHDGRGVARLNGKTIFIDGALPDEEITARITETHKRFDEAELISVDLPSSFRVNPTCQHYNECGGCQLQHLSDSRQIQLKEENVLSQLKRMSNLAPLDLAPPLLSESFGYRRSARIGLNVLQRNDEVIAGFRRRKSNKLLQIELCPVLVEGAQDIFPALQAILSDLSSPKQFTHAEVQVGDNGLCITLRCKGNLKTDDKSALTTWANQQLLNLYIETDTQHQLLAKQYENTYSLLDGSITLAFEPGDFLQINPSVNDLMIQQAMSWLSLKDTDNVLDLFCGLGNFTLPISTIAKSVTGIEGIDKMVERATENAAANQRTNTSFYRADLSTDISTLPWFSEKFTKIILDPPRTGAFNLLKQLPTTASHILYISCEPSALARDAELLKDKGYTMTRFGVMDMFPQTNHIESMALFEKQSKKTKKKKLL